MKARKLKRKIKLKSKIFNFFKNNDIPLKNIDLCVNIPLKNIDFIKKYLKNLGSNNENVTSLPIYMSMF